MAERPYTVLSCAMSIDGFIAGPGGRPLGLSSPADFDRVDAVRAGCDAILVGAGTLRSDNPRLLVRSAARRDRRSARGSAPSPRRVTITAGGGLDPAASFFTPDAADPLVYCASPAVDEARTRLGSTSTVVDGGQPVELRRITEDLHRRGVRRLLVEGGRSIHSQFLVGELADELQLVVAPLFVGDSSAPRFVSDGAYPWNSSRRAALAEVRQLDDVVLLRYALSSRFRADPSEED